MRLIAGLLGGLVCVLLAQGAAAQDRISPKVFLDRAEGRTLTFDAFPDGFLVGREQFLRRDLSVWARADGTCTYGRVFVREGQLCFAYDDTPEREYCWLTFVYGDDLMVMSTRNLDQQRVSEITKEPVQCRDAPLS